MPGFNGTGPMGMGPRTGGGFGFCSPEAGTAFPGSRSYGNNRAAGRGLAPRGGGRGRVFGGGRGRGYFGRGIGPGWWGSYPSGTYASGPSPTDEKSFLEEQLHSLEQELSGVRSRIEELEKKPGE